MISLSPFLSKSRETACAQNNLYKERNYIRKNLRTHQGNHFQMYWQLNRLHQDLQNHFILQIPFMPLSFQTSLYLTRLKLCQKSTLDVFLGTVVQNMLREGLWDGLKEGGQAHSSCHYHMLNADKYE